MSYSSRKYALIAAYRECKEPTVHAACKLLQGLEHGDDPIRLPGGGGVRTPASVCLEPNLADRKAKDFMIQFFGQRLGKISREPVGQVFHRRGSLHDMVEERIAQMKAIEKSEAVYGKRGGPCRRCHRSIGRFHIQVRDNATGSVSETHYCDVCIWSSLAKSMGLPAQERRRGERKYQEERESSRVILEGMAEAWRSEGTAKLPPDIFAGSVDGEDEEELNT